MKHRIGQLLAEYRPAARAGQMSLLNWMEVDADRDCVFDLRKAGCRP
jgi:hypothetical protein